MRAIKAFVCAALASGLAWCALGGVALAAPADDIPAAPAAEPAPGRVISLGKKPCGAAADGYYCGTITQGGQTTLSTPPFVVDARKGDVITVTWNGTVYCAYKRFDPGGAAQYVEAQFLVNLQLQSGAATTPELNGEGATTLGRREIESPKSDFITGLAELFILQPVSLTRRFEIQRAGRQRYLLSVAGDFRVAARNACNVNGGAMTATIVR